MAQWKDKARAAEAEVQKLQSQLAHVEHASRAQELTLDQLKGRLTDKVTREERLARRDAEAYTRLKRAYLSTKGSHLFSTLWLARRIHMAPDQIHKTASNSLAIE